MIFFLLFTNVALNMIYQLLQGSVVMLNVKGGLIKMLLLQQSAVIVIVVL